MALQTRNPEDPLTDALAALWPGAGVVRGRGRAPRGCHQEFVVLPGAGGSGRAVPVAPAVASRAVRNWSAAGHPRSVAMRSVAAVALRLGLGAAVRDRVTVAGPAEGSLRDLLCAVFDEDVTFSVTVGTHRVNRKPVLEIFDRRGRSRGFAKIGLSWVAARDVAAETSALPHVAGLDDIGIAVPQLVWAGTWHDVPVLVMSVVPRGLRQRRSDRSQPPVHEMRAFTDHFAQPPAQLAGSAWLRQLEHAFAQIDDVDLGRRTWQCLQTLLARAGDRPVPMSAWHGDWTPWNMARHRGRLGLWDWERFATGVPAGMDLMHYRVNVATVRSGTGPDVVQRALAAAPADSRCPAHDVLTGCYLAAINARYLPLAQGPGGAAIAARAEVFLCVWERWCAGVSHPVR